MLALFVKLLLKLAPNLRVLQAKTRKLLVQWRCRVAICKCNCSRQKLLYNFLVGRLRAHRRDMRRQPPRRGKAGEPGVRRRQALGLELVKQHAGKGVTQLLQRLRGQLFNKQFDQKILRAHGQAAFFCSSATHSRGAMGKPSRSRLS